MDSFLAMLALIGAVIVVSALLSGWVDRTGVPQVAVFLGMGALIGPIGLALLDASAESPVLRVVATVSLVLVLFTDAVSLDLKEVRQHRLLAGLVLGPGTILFTAILGAVAHYMLGLSWPLAAILSAAIASTDPVLLRGVLKRPALHNGVRQALRLESGLNDVVLLPVVLVSIALLTSSEPFTGTDWGRLAVNILLLSPAAGVVVGFAGVKALEFARRRMGVRRDYESIYSLGLAFAAYAAAESVHGSGFIAAFAAGLTISALDVELCDCFLEYGETTAEMALLFTFVLFGTSIIWSGVSAASMTTIAFVIIAIFLRPLALLPALAPVALSWKNRGLIGWFGPRGLSTLLLVMLPVFAGIEGSYGLLQVSCLVVMVSVVLHGFSPMILLRGKAEQRGQLPLQVISSAPAARNERTTITVDAYLELKQSGAPVVLVDSRTDRTYDIEVANSVRVHPDRAVADAIRYELPHAATLVVFCA
ncbi:MAG: cation:proton antiporter [Vicinamibacterales bacterium]